MMEDKHNNTGFSLTEVLLAVGVLAVGMIFIAGVFPVAIHFTTIASERTIAAVAADEAFAKIKLYAMGGSNIDFSRLRQDELRDFTNVLQAGVNVDPNEFAYPSTDTDITQKQYHWSALCRRVDLSNVQVTVFVCRRIGAGTSYWDRETGSSTLVTAPYPVPVNVNVSAGDNADELLISDDVAEETFINDGCTIVDNKTGRLYRVLEREDDTILLDRRWQSELPGSVWVIPPPVGGGRYPCIAVYQKVIRF